MKDKTTDVQQTLSYMRRKSLHWRWLGLGVLCVGIGGLFAVWQPNGFTFYDWFMTALAFGVGLIMTVYAAVRLFMPGKPAVMLSPQGIRIHIEWVKDIVIPWRTVRGIETIDVTGWYRGHPVEFPGVTVALVSRDFYDRHIHIDNWVLRGPGWDSHFIPKDGSMQVAFHHEGLDATAAELRSALEARWRTFGRPPAPP